MKRSEMIKELTAFFWNIDNNAFSPCCYDDDIKLLAKQTLEFIEKKGMVDYIDCGYIHKWEPENENV